MVIGKQWVALDCAALRREGFSDGAEPASHESFAIAIVSP
jgi:hypothetical protein